MKRLLTLLAACLAFALLAAAPALGAFELINPEVEFSNEDTSIATQAGSHPFAMTTTLAISRTNVPEGGRCKPESPSVHECEIPDGQLRNMRVVLPPGFVGNQTAIPPCSGADFANIDKPTSQPACPDSTAIGVTGVQVEFDPIEVGRPFPYTYVPVYNLVPPPGSAAEFGFVVLGVPITVEVAVAQSFPYNLEARLHNTSQAVLVYGAQLTVWGNPAAEVHDPIRGHCIDAITSSGEIKSLGECPAGIEEEAFLTLPRSCGGPLVTPFAATSWKGDSDEASAETAAIDGCTELEFAPTFAAQPTTLAPESATGIDVAIDVDDEGLLDPDEEAFADIEKTVVTLPEGMSVNPSAANGLQACSKAEYEAASVQSPGCRGASKLGGVHVTTPLLEEPLGGDLYVAQQDDPATPQPGAENPFDSLLAVYLVIRNEALGVLVKQAGEVETNKATGQITTSFENIPQFPLSHIGVDFREGPRAPLVTPRSCGTYTTKAELTPSSGGPALATGQDFTITASGSSPCPAGPPPFAPGLKAGTLDNTASVYSPFTMRITRSDGEADITRLDSTLPAGVVAKIAGLGRCTEAQIAAAKAKTGRQELAQPSCPANTEIGRVEAGAGLGSVLTYVSGKVYLAGPFGGDPLSVVVITPAVAGPFDIGNVVVREALNLNPVTARPEIDGAASDPIPRILEGIPLHLRDLRVFVDRPNFTVNATSCDPLATQATLWGAGPGLPTVPAALSAPYQAASCANLGFNPKLSLRLKGGTKRSGHPALHSVLTYPYPSGPGYANIAKAVVTLPSSEFIDQDRVNNPCTRVQFDANACPKASLLGRAKAISPLLDEPLEGPVYFRSNGGERELPDLVADLRGQFQVVLVGFVDAKVKGENSRIRTTFAQVPDAPVTKFTLDLFGGKRGLLENSRNLCAHPLKANLVLRAQNGRLRESRPKVAVSCKGKKKGSGKKR